MVPLLIMLPALANLEAAGLPQLGWAAVQPEFEAGLEMMRQVLLYSGVSDQEIERLSDSVRHEYYRPLAVPQHEPPVELPYLPVQHDSGSSAAHHPPERLQPTLGRGVVVADTEQSRVAE